MNFPSKETVERIRKLYPKGIRVILLKMDDPQAPPYGTRGTVRGVDDTASLLVDWDNGSRLNVLYGVDKVLQWGLNNLELIDLKELEKEVKSFDEDKDAENLSVKVRTGTFNASYRSKDDTHKVYTAVKGYKVTFDWNTYDCSDDYCEEYNFSYSVVTTEDPRKLLKSLGLDYFKLSKEVEVYDR